MERYLVIIARDQPELLRTFASVYGHGGVAEIRFDRRNRQLDSVEGEDTNRRSPLARDTLLREQGFIVIPRF
jgi:hypothetical protein